MKRVVAHRSHKSNNCSICKQLIGNEKRNPVDIKEDRNEVLQIINSKLDHLFLYHRDLEGKITKINSVLKIKKNDPE